MCCILAYNCSYISLHALICVLNAFTNAPYCKLVSAILDQTCTLLLRGPHSYVVQLVSLPGPQVTVVNPERDANYVGGSSAYAQLYFSAPGHFPTGEAMMYSIVHLPTRDRPRSRHQHSKQVICLTHARFMLIRLNHLHKPTMSIIPATC